MTSSTGAVKTHLSSVHLDVSLDANVSLKLAFRLSSAKSQQQAGVLALCAANS